MSALCNLDYQINNQQLKTALDDFIKVGVGGRRRKRKLKFVYGNEEARFDFQGDVLNITHNGMTKGVEASCVTKCQEVPIRLAQIWRSLFLLF